jgi:uncharacterized membrane protein
MTDTTVKSPPAGDDRYVALVNYGLLFASIFFAGVPALIAVVIAYAQRDHAGPLRSHYDFQIRIFWVSFALTLVGVAFAIAAVVMGVGEAVRFGSGVGWDAWGAMSLDFSEFNINASLIASIVISALAFLLSVLWLIAAPALGFIRLASERRIGQQAP